MTISALVILNGDDVFEPLLDAGGVLQSIAVDAGFPARQRYGMGVLDRADAEDAGMLVLYTARGRFTPEQQSRLAALVGGGRGLVAVHASNVLDAVEDRAAFELIGSRYASHGPEPRWSTFTVELDRDHPVTEGVGDFTVFHEHYRLELAGGDLRVLGRRGDEPVLTVRSHGDGRVVYLQLGHDLATLGHPSVQRLLRQAMLWASSAS